MLRPVLLIASVAALTFGLGDIATVSAQQKSKKNAKGPPQPAAEEHTGLAVGQKAPAVKLLDQNNRERTLSEMYQDGKLAAVVFYRSASW